MSLEIQNNSLGNPVTVCFVIENLLPAGTELWLRQLVSRLDRTRIRPLVCLTDGSQGRNPSGSDLNCEVLRLHLKTLKSLRLAAKARQFHRFLTQHRVDILQVHHADPTYLAVPIGRWAGVPTIVQTKYDVGYWLKGFDLWLHRRLRQWIDVTVANCEACRQAAVAQEGAPRTETIVLANGIDTELLMPIPPIDVARWNSQIRVGMLANLRPVKAPQDLVAAAARLAHDARFEFHFAGDGELRSALQRQIAELRLTDRVHLHGQLPASQFLSNLDISVLCSRSEGLPHTILESMAAARPVIATQVGGNAEVVQSGKTGLLIPPSDVEALVEAIVKLSNEPDMARTMGLAGRQAINATFGLDAMTERFTTFYEQLGRRSYAPSTSSSSSSHQSAHEASVNA